MKNILLTGAPGSGKTTIIKKVLATITRADEEFAKEIKDRGDVLVLEVKKDNRDALPAEIASLLLS